MTTLRSLLTPDKPDAPAPHIDRVTPIAAMPGGEIDLYGQHLDPHGPHIPRATIGDVSAPLVLSRPTRATIRIPEGSISGDLILHRSPTESNPISLRVAVPMAENLHPVANPAVDADGNAVSSTYTLNFGFGSGITVSPLGFLLNDEMDDFASKQGVPNGFGLIQGPANAIAPGKRPLSSMTPTIVSELSVCSANANSLSSRPSHSLSSRPSHNLSFRPSHNLSSRPESSRSEDAVERPAVLAANAVTGCTPGKLRLVLGSPGGSTIITTVANDLISVIDNHLDIQAAADAPRFHHQYLPDILQFEKSFPIPTIEALKATGYTTKRESEFDEKSPGTWGDSELIEVDPLTNQLRGGQDHRHPFGKAAGY